MRNEVLKGVNVFFLISVLTISFVVITACKKEKSVFAVADFSFSGNVSANLPVTVQFVNSSIGLSYLWDFGDGNSSVEENPKHTYVQYGIYHVTLIAKGTNNVDKMEVVVIIGGTLGQISSLNCSSTQVNETIKTGDSIHQLSVFVPYTGGNGGVFNGQSVPSTGVTGLTATLAPGSLANGSGSLEYKLSGTPQTFGEAKFDLNIGDVSCELDIVVLDSGDYIPRNGLIAWWPFNGNANDESGNGNNGTVYGANLTPNRFGDSNSAYLFSNSSIECNNINIPSNSFSLSVWVLQNQPFNMNGGMEFICLGNPSNTKWGAMFSSPYTTMNYGRGCGGTGSSTINPPINLGTWYHLVYISRGAGQSTDIYINGVFVGVTTNGNTNSCSTANLYFGVDIWATPEYINGKLDDIGIWNRALTQQEITMLFNASH